MTLCENCIHEKVCADSKECAESENLIIAVCGQFKNKADFVEVVRCKDCKYIQTMSDGKTLACIRQSAYRKPTDFCSYGEKRSDT